MKNIRRFFTSAQFIRSKATVCLAAGLSALILLGQGGPLLAAEPQVLTVRPDKIREASGRKNFALPLSRDPFNWSREQISMFKSREPREKSSSIAGLTISGIIWDKTRPQAVINGKLVGKGEVSNSRSPENPCCARRV